MLVVSPYPPARDGIAAYALQQVRALRRAGHDVDVLSPGPSAAQLHLDLLSPRAGLALTKRVRAYDRVIVQFHPSFFYPEPATPARRARVSSALAVAFAAARDVEVYVHEIDYRYGHGHGPDAVATRAMWRAVDRVYVHTETEQRDFVAAFGLRGDHVLVAEHGQDFTRRTFHTRASARETLRIDADVFTFLSIGFIQPHKGFDRAVRAFAGLSGLDGRGCRYDVVGSVRVEDAAYVAYFHELTGLVEGTPGAHLHSGFVSDELFDRWLVAADVIVLPYREIWSSGVLERAALYGVPVIATAVGGLAEQAGDRPGVTLVADDAELRAVMWRAAGVGTDQARTRAPWPTAGAELRNQVQAEVRTRAAAHRGGLVARSAGIGAVAGSTALSAPVRRIAALVLPQPVSARPGASLAKRVVSRLTAWQVEPIVGQLNALRNATVESIERVGAERTDAAASGGVGHSAGGESNEGGGEPNG